MKQISKKVLVALCAASMATTCFSSVAFAGYTAPVVSTSTFSTSDENVIAVLQPKYINSGLSDLIAEAGIVLSSVDQIYVVNQTSTTRNRSVNELKIVQQSGDTYTVSYLSGYTETMDATDLVKVSPSRSVVSPSVTVTEANVTMKVTCSYTKISRSSAPVGLFIRPRSVSMSFTTNSGVKISNVTLSCQAEGIKCNSNFEQSSPYDPEFVIYIEQSFSNVSAGSTISSSTVKPSGFSGYVQYYGGASNNIYVTVEGTTSAGKMIAFTRPMLTVE